jgi:Mn-dependent DtxR family transcriptional regulator
MRQLINESKEDYLEAILILSKSNTEVKAIHIAKELGYSKPSVSVALKSLASEGYIFSINNSISLSAKGLQIANSTYSKHELIASLLIYLGVDSHQAYIESCGIEHHLSNDSYEKLKDFINDVISKPKK